MRYSPHLLAGVAAAVLTTPARPPDGPPATFPPHIKAYFDTHVALDQAARTKLLAGEPVSRLLPSDQSKEVAVFGAVWIAAPIERYLAAVHDIERFESGGAFRVTKKIGDPPRLEDFAAMELPQEDVDDLRGCRVADCQLKLSEAAIERARREIDWTRRDVREQVNRMTRQLALEHVQSYRAGGNDALAVYRDSSHPTFVAREFANMVEQLTPLQEYLPSIRRYLLEYPKVTLPRSESFLYWQEATFGLKPTIRINHLVIARDDQGATVASKMLYASHYFWTALELRVLVRDPGGREGFWFVLENRSRSDGLSGFTGKFIRGKVRGEAEKGTEAVLALTKRTFETGR